MKVYLAGPITGLTLTDGESWRTYARKELGVSGIDAYSPLRGHEALASHGVIEGAYPQYAAITAKAIVTRDYNDCTTSDMVLVNLLGAKRISIGSVMEIAWAYAARVPCLLVVDEGNVHSHPMVEECVGWIVPDLEQAITLVKSVLLP